MRKEDVHELTTFTIAYMIWFGFVFGFLLGGILFALAIKNKVSEDD